MLFNPLAATSCLPIMSFSVVLVSSYQVYSYEEFIHSRLISCRQGGSPVAVCAIAARLTEDELLWSLMMMRMMRVI